MLKNSLKIAVSICLAGGFLWLAFRNVALSDLLIYFSSMNYGWLPPYVMVVVVSHWARTERWLLLLKEEEGVAIKKKKLFTGVMLGYAVNYAVPRLGEVSRCVYVAKKHNVSASALLGTVILERILDLICLAGIMLVVGFYLISDITILQNIFGDRIINYLQNFYTFQNIVKLIAAGLAVVGFFWGVLKLADLLSYKYKWVEKLYRRFQQLNRTLLDGLMSLRNVDNWWLFAVWTGLIWIGYTLLMYLPFWMFDLQSTYNLTMLDAVSIMAIASIGIVIPSPGGVGTYHYFVKQALLFLASVPALTGLAYALVTHAVMMLVVLLVTLIMIFIDAEKGFGINDLRTLNESKSHSN